MNKYPYYVAAFMDAGILRKIFNDKKFKSYTAAVDATVLRYNNMSKITGRNLLSDMQVVILEYTKEYQGRIITVFTNGKKTIISEPQVIS